MRVVVPFAAGGLNDTMARIFSQQLSERLKVPFLIDNRPGAGGTTGTAIVAQAVSDGYTLLFSSSTTIAVSPSLFLKLPYDPVRDFAPVTTASSVEIVLLVNPQFPARTVKEIIALARAQPGEIKYGSVGLGSSQHLAGELFGAMAGVQLLHVPYKAAGQVLTDTINGQISLDFEPMPTALPHVKAGRLRPIAVTMPRRSSVLPDLPTIAEAGLPGYEMVLWTGLLAPRATPQPIVDQLNATMRSVLAADDLKERLLGLGATPMGSTPEQFGTFIRSEIKRWAEVVKASGAKPE
ncbi:MAG: tripartite tricarboxylate transporter substrate binding protein [Proteobacteria bacterium]|nr:tripartite tricarboxylate transporter substrate binding protein [Burkholderiales bacterium]